MTILGIDPGIKNIGVASITLAPEEFPLEAWTVPIGELWVSMIPIIAHARPTLVAIERPFAAVNLRDYGETWRVIGVIEAQIQAFGITSEQIIYTNVRAANTLLGLSGRITDAKKRMAGVQLYGLAIENAHEASAAAAAELGWHTYYDEMMQLLEVNEDAEI